MKTLGLAAAMLLAANACQPRAKTTTMSLTPPQPRAANGLSVYCTLPSDQAFAIVGTAEVKGKVKQLMGSYVDALATEAARRGAHAIQITDPVCHQGGAVPLKPDATVTVKANLLRRLPIGSSK